VVRLDILTKYKPLTLSRRSGSNESNISSTNACLNETG